MTENYGPGIKIKEKVICINCDIEIEYDDILGYHCEGCGQYIKIMSND